MHQLKSLCMLFCATAAFAVSSAAQTVVVVTSPANNSKLSSPVHYVASATTSCPQGISGMRIYLAPHQSRVRLPYDHIDVLLPLIPGVYATVVQAFDNCGGVGKTAVNITVTPPDLQPAKFLYVADFANLVRGFTVDPNSGAVSPTMQAQVSTTGSYRIASDVGGYRLYVTNAGPIPFSQLYGYFIDRRNGALSPIPGSPYPVNWTTGPVLVHPSGKFVFVGTIQSVGGIIVYRVNPDGSLSLLTSTPVPTSSDPAAMAIDKFGQYLYVLTTTGDVIDGFSIDTSSGALTSIGSAPVFTSGCTPGATNLDFFFGRYLYTADTSASEISGYATSGGKNGGLGGVAGSPFKDNGGCATQKAGPAGIVVEPSGKFLYVANSLLGDISIYSLNPGNGTLTYLKDTTPFSGLPLYGPLRVDPSGKFLYSRDSTANDDKLAGFAINQTTGDLTPVTGSPFSLGTSVLVFDFVVTP
jgi:6-phosphogluconolactonase (cycloisomerase 2 family)